MWAVEEARIIPARAGFTPDNRRGTQRHGDHPRSRGVYNDLHGCLDRRPGSSPLARGLRDFKDALRLGFGIIPACAGFTLYDTVPQPHEEGSSPLARGLLSGLGLASVVLRIIPACAGFTVTAPWVGTRRRDHPRLRGVYARDSRPSRAPGGSSPLARGLPAG